MKTLYDWIKWALTSSAKRYPFSSRSIKHDAERMLHEHIFERDFTTTMIVAGFLPVEDDGHDAYFNAEETTAYHRYLLGDFNETE